VPTRLSILLTVMAGLVLSGCVSSGTSPLSWYATQDARAPQGLAIGICHAFGCQRQTTVRLSETDVTVLAGIMEQGRESPQAERAAIAPRRHVDGGPRRSRSRICQ
jgi:outer membrane lipoprotein SlyB